MRPASISKKSKTKTKKTKLQKSDIKSKIGVEIQGSEYCELVTLQITKEISIKMFNIIECAKFPMTIQHTDFIDITNVNLIKLWNQSGLKFLKSALIWKRRMVSSVLHFLIMPILIPLSKAKQNFGI